MLRRAFLIVALLLAPAWAWAAPIPIKVVVLTTFEAGATAAVESGEFKFWAERYPLTHPLKVPGIQGRVLYSDDGVLGVVTGMRARARESVAAIILDPRLDVSHAYWVVAGIAGVDPRTGSIGSAAWANWVVDADPIFERDDREIPPDWPYGLWSLGTDRPNVKGAAPGSSGMAWKLDPGLVRWAYQMTRDTPLPDNDLLRRARAGYASEPVAQRPPFVFIGDGLSTTRFWHGERRTQWARDWVKTWTNGQGVFAMTDCEDQGILDVLDLFAQEGRVDLKRVLVLRTASNYSREPDGVSAGPVKFTPGGGAAAFEAAYRVGAPVVKALVAGWSKYATAIPQAAEVPAP
jgi:purine nucleoside permease